METIDILSMFTLGLLAQGHCIGMCGPLIIAFPGRTGRFMPHLLLPFRKDRHLLRRRGDHGGNRRKPAANRRSHVFRSSDLADAGQDRFCLDRRHVSLSFRHQPDRPGFRARMDGGRNSRPHSRIPPHRPGGHAGQQSDRHGAAGADDGAAALRSVLWGVCHWHCRPNPS